MTPQEVFDAAVGGIIKQDALCKTDDGGCLYRYGGHKCVAGQVIPDNLYEPDFEGTDIEGVLEMSPRLNELLGQHAMMLAELQREHDQAASVEVFLERAKYLATDRGLSWNFQ